MNKNQLKDMRDVHEIQGYDGNWNYDAYMHGMYNGMELMVAISEGREPVYREAPEQWLKDIKDNSKPVEAKEAEHE